MPILSPRLILQLEAGLNRESGCAETIQRLMERGRALGLTRAEVDAALQGGSFEVRAAAAIALASAVKTAKPEVIALAQQASARVGFTAEEIGLIERFATAQPRDDQR